jgi:hypothetical protein
MGASSFLQPLRGGFEKRACNILILKSLEKPEEAPAIPVTIKVPLIVHGANPSHCFPCRIHTQEWLDRGMKMEWKAFLVEHLLLLEKKGGNPVGVILVNFPGKAKELIEQTFAGNRNNV